MEQLVTVVLHATDIRMLGKERLDVRGDRDRPERGLNVIQRAAWALTQMQPDFENILEQVVATGDRYALEAFTSELERSGAFEKVVRALEQHCDSKTAAAPFRVNARHSLVKQQLLETFVRRGELRLCPPALVRAGLVRKTAANRVRKFSGSLSS